MHLEINNNLLFVMRFDKITSPLRSSEPLVIIVWVCVCCVTNLMSGIPPSPHKHHDQILISYSILRISQYTTISMRFSIIIYIVADWRMDLAPNACVSFFFSFGKVLLVARIQFQSNWYYEWWNCCAGLLLAATAAICWVGWIYGELGIHNDHPFHPAMHFG